MRNEINLYFASNAPNGPTPATLWLAHKTVIRGILIGRAAYLKRVNHNTLITLLKRVQDLHRSNQANPTKILQQQIQTTQNEINEIHLRKANAALKKLKATSYSMGNKATKLLALRLRDKQAQTRTQFLYTQSGQKVMQPTQICNEFARCNGTLYNSRPP
ncbi:Hypothetical predicted protein [Pelobates cultripes]|uniref:Uncharacterized protein n=1 Tax=Pelobates cultripes TaxID=61616 RepID=A0AAD1SXH5_PELCU|nr:Hypothetical predicted protein [Pelobates cultripes]